MHVGDTGFTGGVTNIVKMAQDWCIRLRVTDSDILTCALLFALVEVMHYRLEDDSDALST